MVYSGIKLGDLPPGLHFDTHDLHGEFQHRPPLAHRQENFANFGSPHTSFSTSDDPTGPKNPPMVRPLTKSVTARSGATPPPTAPKREKIESELTDAEVDDATALELAKTLVSVVVDQVQRHFERKLAKATDKVDAENIKRELDKIVPGMKTLQTLLNMPGAIHRIETKNKIRGLRNFILEKPSLHKKFDEYLSALSKALKIDYTPFAKSEAGLRWAAREALKTAAAQKETPAKPAREKKIEPKPEPEITDLSRTPLAAFNGLAWEEICVLCGFDPRVYQEDWFNNTRAHATNGFDRAYVGAPTQTGKTLASFPIAVAMAAALYPNKTIVFVVRERVVKQDMIDNIRTIIETVRAKMCAAGLIDASTVKLGVIDAQNKDFGAGYDVVIASLATLSRDEHLLSIDPDNYGIIATDECDSLLTKPGQAVLKRFGMVDDQGTITKSDKHFLFGMSAVSGIISFEPVFGKDARVDDKDLWWYVKRDFLHEPIEVELPYEDIAESDWIVTTKNGESRIAPKDIQKAIVNVYRYWVTHLRKGKIMVPWLRIEHAILAAAYFNMMEKGSAYAHHSKNHPLQNRLEWLKFNQDMGVRVMHATSGLSVGARGKGVVGMIFPWRCDSMRRYGQWVGRLMGIHRGEKATKKLILQMTGWRGVTNNKPVVTLARYLGRNDFAPIAGDDYQRLNIPGGAKKESPQTKIVVRFVDDEMPEFVPATEGSEPVNGMPLVMGPKRVPSQLQETLDEKFNGDIAAFAQAAKLTADKMSAYLSGQLIKEYRVAERLAKLVSPEFPGLFVGAWSDDWMEIWAEAFPLTNWPENSAMAALTRALRYQSLRAEFDDDGAAFAPVNGLPGHCLDAEETKILIRFLRGKFVPPAETEAAKVWQEISGNVLRASHELHDDLIAELLAKALAEVQALAKDKQDQEEERQRREEEQRQAEEAARLEAERVEAEQAAAEAARVEAERLAAELAAAEAARVEAAAAERAETERLTAEEAARLEAERVAAEEAAEAARAETERIAAIAAALYQEETARLHEIFFLDLEVWLKALPKTKHRSADALKLIVLGGLKELGEFLQKPKGEILKIKGLGQTTLSWLEDQIAELAEEIGIPLAIGMDTRGWQKTDPAVMTARMEAKRLAAIAAALYQEETAHLHAVLSQDLEEWLDKQPPVDRHWTRAQSVLLNDGAGMHELGELLEMSEDSAKKLKSMGVKTFSWLKERVDVLAKETGLPLAIGMDARGWQKSDPAVIAAREEAKAKAIAKTKAAEARGRTAQQLAEREAKTLTMVEELRRRFDVEVGLFEKMVLDTVARVKTENAAEEEAKALAARLAEETLAKEKLELWPQLDRHDLKEMGFLVDPFPSTFVTCPDGRTVSIASRFSSLIPVYWGDVYAAAPEKHALLHLPEQSTGLWESPEKRAIKRVRAALAENTDPTAADVATLYHLLRGLNQDFAWSNPTLSRLNDAGFITLAKVVAATDAELKAIPDFRPRDLSEIKSVLARVGLENGLPDLYEKIASIKKRLDSEQSATALRNKQREERSRQAQEKQKQELYSKLDGTLTKIHLPSRVQGGLESVGIVYIGDMVKHTAESLTELAKGSIRGFGAGSLQEVVKHLGHVGLTLGQDSLGWTRPEDRVIKPFLEITPEMGALEMKRRVEALLDLSLHTVAHFAKKILEIKSWADPLKTVRDVVFRTESEVKQIAHDFVVAYNHERNIRDENKYDTELRLEEIKAVLKFLGLDFDMKDTDAIVAKIVARPAASTTATPVAPTTPALKEKEQLELKKTLDLPCRKLKLNPSLFNMLQEADIICVGDLVKKKPEELFEELPDFDDDALREVTVVLALLTPSLKLGQDTHGWVNPMAQANAAITAVLLEQDTVKKWQLLKPFIDLPLEILDAHLHTKLLMVPGLLTLGDIVTTDEFELHGTVFLFYKNSLRSISDAKNRAHEAKRLAATHIQKFKHLAGHFGLELGMEKSAIIKQVRRAAAKPTKPVETPEAKRARQNAFINQRLSELGLSKATTDALTSLGFEFLWQVAALSKERLLALPNIDDNMVTEILYLLAAQRLKLGTKIKIPAAGIVEVMTPAEIQDVETNGYDASLNYHLTKIDFAHIAHITEEQLEMLCGDDLPTLNRMKIGFYLKGLVPGMKIKNKATLTTTPR